MRFAPEAWVTIVSPVVVGTHRVHHLANIDEEIVPLGVNSITAVSPAAKVIISDVSLHVVEVFEIVHVRAVAEPFFKSVKAYEFPLPGEVLNSTYNLLIVPAVGIMESRKFKVEFGVLAPDSTPYWVPDVARAALRLVPNNTLSLSVVERSIHPKYT